MTGDGDDGPLARARALVEQAIRDLGVDPASARTEGPSHVAYALRRGSARIAVVVQPPADAGADGRLRVVAPIVRLPEEAERPGLFEYLLRANAVAVRDCAFAITDDEVLVVAERSVRYLDGPEVDAILRTVGAVADRFDDELHRAFGAPRASDPA
jgi:hypothetical protein